MTKKTKLISLLLAVITVMSVLPMSVFADCAHNYVRVYQMENASMHSYKSRCVMCGTVSEGWGLSGWLDHSFNSYGTCVDCGYYQAPACAHYYANTVYQYENDSMHSYYGVCTSCGQRLEGYGYSGWLNHNFSGNTCMQCEFTKACSHLSSTPTYSQYDINSHRYAQLCQSCGIVFNTTILSHAWSYGAWSAVSESEHQRTKSCICGAMSSESSTHYFSGNMCSGCGYQKVVLTPVNASVSLSASSFNGSLGSAGGEISSESVPASYTVYASASNCEVTQIVYVKDGVSYTSYGNSVTITANSEKDFATTTFTAYTNVSGVTATITVNHKYVKKNSAQIKWETSHDATIRSITGNGLNKSLAYSMTIPNSYDGQSNLTDEQVATIQSLIGQSDGKTYTVNYTRTITVYTPAEYSSTGQNLIRGTYDGNNMSEIEQCLSTWGWTESTKTAIRQAASSSLSFTTGLPIDCTAVWVDSSTGREIHTMKFGSGYVYGSKSTVVSTSYTDYSNSGSYVYESLAYSGDTSGTSNSQSYSQTYTSSSKPLTVTFYCHPPVTSGTITVRAIDGDTGEIIADAELNCDGDIVGNNPHTFSNVALGTYTVSAYAIGYGSASSSVTITAAENTKTVTLKLYRQDGDITVYVKDSVTRQPIYGASVSSGNSFGSTDASGRVAFSGIPFGTHTFNASANGYQPNSGSTSISRTNFTSEVTIYLDPIPQTGDITVTVVDRSTGYTIGGAFVVGAGMSGYTNIYGSVTFGNVPFNSYTFTASADGYYSNSSIATISTSKMSDSIIIYLDPIPTVGNIYVTVLDSSTKQAINGANVSGLGMSVSADFYGKAAFFNVPFGSFTFTASADGYYSNSETASISLYNMTASITIYLDQIPTSGDITVYVKDKDTGAAISGATVSGSGYTKSTNTSGTAVFADLNFGTHTFTASAFEYESASGSASISETNTTASVTIYLEKQQVDLSIDAYCNGTIYKGSTIMVSAEVKNYGDIALTPDRPATVTMTAKRNGNSVFDTQTKTVIIPSNDSNLVWFEVDMPSDGFSSNTVTFEFTVTAPSGVKETNLTNNSDSLSKTVTDLPDRDCEDSGFSTTVPSTFSNTSYTNTDCEALTWSVYEWDGGFVRKTYTAKLAMTAKLVPNANAGYRVESGGIWTTRSGYGVDTESTVTVDTTSTEVVGNLKVDTFYPEHNYSTAANKSDRLELVGGKYVFVKNSTSVNDSRMHGIPLWFPDGTYSVKYYAYDVWCPAGMLTGYTSARVTIDGDMYDDLYTN